MALSSACALVACARLAVGCGDTPHTTVAISNHFDRSAPGAPVVYDAFWHAVSFQGAALAPGETSDAMDTVPASSTTAYVVLARGWDPAGAAPPASLVVMRSRAGFEARLNDALVIPVDDTTFVGDCAAGAPLDQAEADFITERVFPADFANVRYDAATCTLTKGAGGAP